MTLGLVPLDQSTRLLTDLVDAVRAAYSTFGVAGSAPDVRLAHGLSAPFDCADVAWVLNRGMTPAPIANADPAANCMVIGDALLAVEVARCWPIPDGGTPNPQAEATAVAELARDETVLWWGLTQAWAERTLFRSFPGLECETVRFGTLAPISPGGGLAGWSLPITVRVGLTRLVE